MIFAMTRKTGSAFFAVLLLAAPGLSTAAELAKVDDVVISTESFEAALKALGPQGAMVAGNPELRKRFLDHMVNSALLARKARAEGFDKDPKFIARLADMTAQLLAGEYMDRHVEKKSGDKEIRDWFEKNKSLFSKKEIHAKHILTDSEDTARTALAEATAKPADFDAIAKKYSKDKSIDLGFFGHGKMVPEFEAAAFGQKPGTISAKPVKTNFGWHVIYVIETRGDDKIAYDSVKQDVQRRYRQAVQEELVHELRAKSKIAVNEQTLKEIKAP
jgi:peptidyl-prolyl cis-trans isomerase C